MTIMLRKKLFVNFLRRGVARWLFASEWNRVAWQRHHTSLLARLSVGTSQHCDQVDSVFTLSVGDLLDPSFRVVDDLGLRGKLPAFTAGPSKVWGLTAAIAEGVLQRGIVPLLKDSPSAADDAGSEPREATPNSAL